LLAVSIPSVYGQIITTQGQNYDLIEDFTIGEAIWTSHPERIFASGEWQNYVLKNTDDNVIFNSNSVGSLIYHKNYCSYTIHENGFNGEVIIPTVSAVAIYLKDGTWQHLPVNDQACTVSTVSYDNGVILTATKTITQDITEDVFIPYTGTSENFYANGTNSSFTLIQSNGTTGYFNGETITGTVVEEFTQEIRMDINSGFKETFKVTHDGDESLGITQTIHTGEEIVIGDTTINIAQYNGQSFDREFIVDNQAEILKLTDELNYDFDEGINSLSNVNIIFEDNKYKVNLDYSSGDFVGYLEIDPTFGYVVSGDKHESAVDSTPANCDGRTWSATHDLTYVTSQIHTTACNVAWFDFDISSIPSNAVPSIVTLNYAVDSTSGSPTDCVIRHITSEPTVSGATTYSQALTGDKISGTDSGCTTSGTGKTISYNGDGLTELQTDISDADGLHAISLFYDSLTGSDMETKFTYNTSELEVTYAIPTAPDAPTNLTTVIGIPVELDWTAPVDDGDSSITGYKVYRTLNEFPLVELPDNSGSDSQIDFSDNELLLHGVTTTTPPTILDTSTNTITIVATVAPVTTTVDLPELALEQGSVRSTGFNQAYPSQVSVGWFAYADSNGIFGYDLSSIPSGATINSITYQKGTGGGDWLGGGGYSCRIYDLSTRPSTNTNVWSDSNGGNQYASGTCNAMLASSGSVSFSSQAVTDMQTQLNSGSSWFGFATDHSIAFNGYRYAYSPWEADRGLDVTYTYTPTLSSTTGTIGNAIEDPDLSYSDSSLPSGTDQISVGGWVELNSSPTDTKLLNINDVTFSVGTTSASVENTATSTTIISATGLTDNTSTPHHYAFTKDSSNLWTIYQDGSSVATATDSTSLGASSSALTTTLDGTLDEFFIDSTAFTSTEIDTIYERGIAPSLIASPTLSEYDDSGVSAGNIYYYTASAVNAIGESPSISPMVSADLPGLANAPTNLGGSPNSSGQPVLTWTPSTDLGGGTLLSMEIQRIVTGSGSTWSTIATTSNTSPPYTDTTVTSGVSYDYRVASINESGIGAFSTPATIIAGIPPDAPTNLTSVIDSPNPSPLVISLDWDAPSNTGTGTLTGYTVYRDGTQVSTTGLTTDTTDTVPASGTFSYQVKAVSTHGVSIFSSSTSITTPTVPDAPTMTLNIPNPNPSPLTVAVNFIAPSNNGGSTITGYNLYHSTDDITYTGVSNPYTVASAGTQYFQGETVNNVGASVRSITYSITTPTVPPAPLNPTSTIPDPDNSPYDVILTWYVPATNGGSAITGYSISRDGNTIGTTNAGTFTFNDTTPSNACTNFDYKIYTINNVGTGTAYANTVITTPCVPNTPVLSIIQTSTTLSWTTPNTGGSIITGYEIHRGNSLLTTVGLVNDYVDHSPITFGNLYTYGIKAINTVGTSNFSNVVQTTPSVDVTTLTPTGITGTGVILFWNEPPYFQGVITDYTILYDTPHNTAPLNVLIANTGTTLSQYTVGNLQYLTDYSFVVMANSVLGSSSNGNVIDITTLLDTSTVSYDAVGSFDIDAVNPNLLNQIKFTRTDSTATNTEGETIDVATVDVEFPLNYNLTCTFNYKFAVTNDTYTNLGYQQGNVTQLNADALQTTFILNDVGNEIVHIICTDVISEDSAEMLVMQNNFPLLQQISAFQSGDFGTEGKFGILDIVVLFTILISMMAFNRVNQIVGIVVSLSFVFAMAWFSIIEIPTAFLGIIAVILMFAIGSHRKQ
jgi:hypothetical protein